MESETVRVEESNPLQDDLSPRLFPFLVTFLEGTKMGKTLTSTQTGRRNERRVRRRLRTPNHNINLYLMGDGMLPSLQLLLVTPLALIITNLSPHTDFFLVRDPPH